jgi:hypothetical protein
MVKQVKSEFYINNWRSYQTSLSHRGSIFLWLHDDLPELWYNPELSGRRGASNDYSEMAIVTMCTIQFVFELAGRQTQGLLRSLFEELELELDVPDHSTLSRRLNKLAAKIPTIPPTGGVVMVVDKGGVKVHTERVWKNRVAEMEKQGPWTKLELTQDEEGEVVMNQEKAKTKRGKAKAS